MLLSSFQIVPQQKLEDLCHFFRILRKDFDQSSRLRVHGGHPHHVRVIFSQTFAAVDGALCPLQALQNFCLLPVGIGEIGFVLAFNLIER